MVPENFRANRRLRRARTDAGRPSADLAAEPLGSRDNPLGLPIRRHRHHPGELARQGRRGRLLPGKFRGESRDIRRRLGGCRTRIKRSKDAQTYFARRGATRRHQVRRSAQARCARCRAASRRRRLVGNALHLGHDRKTERCAAPPTRRTRRGGRSCRAESL